MLSKNLGFTMAITAFVNMLLGIGFANVSLSRQILALQDATNGTPG